MVRVPPRILTKERVTEINERIAQGGLAGFLGSLVGDDSLSTTKVTYADRGLWLAASLGANAEEFASSRLLRCISTCSNGDPKLYGGLDPLITSRHFPIGRTSPRFIDMGAEVMSMDLRAIMGMQVLFMPDVLLLYKRKRYEVVSYEDLKVEGGAVLCADLSPPQWAEKVGHTWVHTNLDGGPDQRYEDNVRVSVVRYHTVSIESRGAGFRLPLLVPDENYAAAVRRLFRETFAHSLRDGPPKNKGGGSTGTSSEGEYRGDQNSQSTPPHAQNRSKTTSAREILGVGPVASEEEIVVAYRKMARLYHPDRVEGLGPEFKELAERRMKEINAAYKELRDR